MKHLLFSFRWILKEWSWNKMLLALNLFLLTIAYVGVLLNLSYQSSTHNFITEQSRFILGGDLVASSTSSPIPEKDLNDIKQRIQSYGPNEVFQAQSIDFLANIRSASSATMAEVYAVSANYPLLGDLHTSGRKQPGLYWESSGAPLIFTDQEITSLLKLKPGDLLKIGNAEFEYAGYIEDKSSLSSGASFVAPRVYIPYAQAMATGLVQFGSQVDYRYYFSISNPEQATSIAKDLEPIFESKLWSIRAASDSLNRIERTLDFVGKYLSWLTLLMILMGFITGFYLSQVHLRKASPRIAILMQMGLSTKRVQSIYGLQILLEQLMAFALSLVILLSLTYTLIRPASLKLPIDLDFNVGSYALFGGLGLSLLMSFLFLFPYLLRLPRLKLKSLLDQSTPFLPEEKGHRSWIPYALILVSFYALTGLFLEDYRLSLVWLGFILLSLCFPVWVFPSLFRKGGENLKTIWLKIPFLQLSRTRFASSLLFVSLCQILFVLSLLPQLHRAIESQLDQTSRDKIPSFFAINIQEEDIFPIKDFFTEKKASLKHLSPMILGRLTHRNNEPVTEKRFLTRPLRLSFRAENLSSEEVVKGLKHLPRAQPTQEIGMVSVEEEYSERHNLKLGDLLRFEIGGIDVQAKVEQIRRVQWESFQPNFFIQFQDGFLNDFPKTYIGVIYDVAKEQRLATLSEAVEQFSSMSLIDLTQTLNKLSEITQTLSTPIKGAAYIQTALTFLILFFLILYHQNSRSEELSLFRLLGASSIKVRVMMTLENTLLAFVAGLLSISLAMGFSKWLTYSVFEVRVDLNWFSPLLALSLSLGCVALITWWSTQRIQRHQ